ncbi:MAG: sugar isomerase, partial [Planctomycetes bacterium]|nr:sugar isomerase [Planctomycetota bacterium]
MTHRKQDPCSLRSCSCCPSPLPADGGLSGIPRRGFLGGLGATALGGLALAGKSWAALSAAEEPAGPSPDRKPLVVKPIFTYGTYVHRDRASWRPWGGVEKPEHAEEEKVRIRGELDKLAAAADFPVKMLPLSAVRSKAELDQVGDLKEADAVIIYAAAAGGDIFDAIAAMGKNIVFFVRYKSGPLYLWYEIIHPRYLRAHTDHLAKEGMSYRDVVVDSQDEILLRLRALCGLKNTFGAKIIAVGGPSGWAHPEAPELARDRWKLDIHTLTYDELGKLIQAARQDSRAMERARRKTDEYLSQPGVTLECKKEFVVGAYVMDDIFRRLMAQIGARGLTLNHCMGTIMNVSDTTGCMNLTWLNDDGFVAFCESDFVVIAAGILLNGISGKPPFLHNPTYPHDGIITLAHCTAPRRMNGKDLEPARILTHYESDFGAAPKIEFTKGQKVTVINSDFGEERWLGLTGTIVNVPFLPICRSQLDLKVDGDCDKLAD